MDFLNSECFLIHNAVEQEHQKLDYEAMVIIIDGRFELGKIHNRN